MKSIRIVTAVDRIPVTSLQGMARISKTEVSLPSGISWEELEIKPHAQLTISDRLEDKNRVWTAKLVFKTCSEPVGGGPYAYRCRLTDGRYKLVGSDGRPYAVTTVNMTMPENITENQLVEVTVNWQSPHFIPTLKE